jgi:hypothetical protein
LLPIGAQLVIPPRQRPAPPVELSPEDTPAEPQVDEVMPRLDVETPPADGGANPVVSQPEAADSSDDQALVPVSKASAGDQETGD